MSALLQIRDQGCLHGALKLTAGHSIHPGQGLRKWHCTKPALVQAWVLDSNIGRARTDAGSDVSKVLEEVDGIPLPVPTRDWLYK